MVEESDSITMLFGFGGLSSGEEQRRNRIAQGSVDELKKAAKRRLFQDS